MVRILIHLWSSLIQQSCPWSSYRGRSFNSNFTVPTCSIDSLSRKKYCRFCKRIRSWSNMLRNKKLLAKGGRGVPATKYLSEFFAVVLFLGSPAPWISSSSTTMHYFYYCALRHTLYFYGWICCYFQLQNVSSTATAWETWIQHGPCFNDDC